LDRRKVNRSRGYYSSATFETKAAWLREDRVRDATAEEYLECVRSMVSGPDRTTVPR
jgi:hypothetical protein